jgi:uncharacterized membrane protein
LVHYPIALFLAALLFDVACIVMRRFVWLDRAAVALYGLGILGAGAAIAAGKLAAEQYPLVSAELKSLLGEHGDWAFFVLIVFIGLALLRFEVLWRDRKEATLRVTRLRLLAFILALGGQWLLLETGKRGAALVYRHGVGVARPK